nr:hypothetical protein Iba_chr06bCG5160 [Ipomoea batatas]GMD10287.1 hypothetical protein Iba_chr06eCG4830 [Ipomoea batatas]
MIHSQSMLPSNDRLSHHDLSPLQILLGQNLTQVLIGDDDAGGGSVLLTPPLLLSFRRRGPLLFGGGGFRPGFLRRRRQHRDEEVNLAALEMSLRRDHDDLGARALVAVDDGAGRRLLKDVFGVHFHDLRRRDVAGNLLDSAVGVHYANHDTVNFGQLQAIEGDGPYMNGCSELVGTM